MKYGLREMVATHLEENRTIYTFTTVLFLIGIVFGAIVVNSLSLTQKHDLYMYLNQFFGHVQEGELANASAIFSQSFAHYAKYFGLMWILGLSIIGLPVILVLLFLKGVVVGFTVGFLVNQMGMSGFFLSFVSIMPQNFILVPAFIIVGTASISFCLKMVRQQFMKRANLPIFPQFMKYSLLILCVGSALVLASAFEAYVSPVLMKWVITTM
ncbi:stage II sporulation protein M [Halalkalibacter akibai]|uniref:Stage II sporulation protein M n=1 Tax=Halalkalibacter akibai (strain ATCC 43226 / DSM 21942 / CIP 109018 / JCM 9157 / 1139) TaxID=1236973 RepID=W4QYV9_HALA3|nr:stage II sporulation protein M [Halalkalibacter akibai]GAE36858.1 stage II sporulation protein M [Halalkalibacter akibai JCM 9157]